MRPSALLGWVLGIGYAAMFLVLELIGKVPYEKLTDSAANVLHAVVIPLAVGAVVIAGVTTYLGWWTPAIREDRPRRPWMLVVPALLFVAVFAGIDYQQLGALGGQYLFYLVLGGIGVGFCEEMAYRGLTLTAMRGSHPEWLSAVLASLLFGLLHGVNVILGQGAGLTLYQVCFAFALGLAFYVARRASGTLIVPMILHGLWDFGAFSYSGAATITGISKSTSLLHLLQTPVALLALLVSLAALPYLFKHAEPPQSK